MLFNNIANIVKCPTCNKLADNAVEIVCCNDIYCKNCSVYLDICKKCSRKSEFADSLAVRKLIDTLDEECSYCGERFQHIFKNNHLSICPYSFSEIINAPSHKIKKPKRKHQPLISEELKQHSINFYEINFEQIPIYSHTTDRINITVLKGFYNSETIIVKSYKALVNLEDLKQVDEEIKILTLLSNRSSPSNCFLKFYGAGRENMTIALYMEAGTYNLMTIISGWRDNNQKPSSEFLEAWIRDLLSSFAELSQMNIYHGDINPHNIVVDNNWKLKIIDFSVGKILPGMECTMSITGANPIQGTKGYMSPELQDLVDRGENKGVYSREKSDVFSLGLTILQLFTFIDLTGYNTYAKNPDLIKIVYNLQASSWVKDLLRRMLSVERKNRISFKNCLKFLKSKEFTISS